MVNQKADNTRPQNLGWGGGCVRMEGRKGGVNASTWGLLKPLQEVFSVFVQEAEIKTMLLKAPHSDQVDCMQM